MLRGWLCLAACAAVAAQVQLRGFVQGTDADWSSHSASPVEQRYGPVRTELLGVGNSSVNVSMSVPFRPTHSFQVRSYAKPGKGHGGHGKDTEAFLQPFLRWIWWLVVAYCFWASAEVCDEYFVPTIELISDTFKIPQDVAGATIMALGCNGPELFINTVSIFKSSDLGLGAVVGGEVFNLLVLCGAAVLATPAVYMPLPISKFSFTRDCLFYAISICLLYWVLYDSTIELYEALILLGSGVVYSTTVALSVRLNRGLKYCVGRSTDAALNDSLVSEMNCTFAGPDDAPIRPQDGCVLGVRELMDNRMMDRFRHWDPRFMRMKPAEGLLLSTDVLPVSVAAGRTARGIAFKHDLHGSGGHWTHGGLVNAPKEILATPLPGSPSISPSPARSSLCTVDDGTVLTTMRGRTNSDPVAPATGSTGEETQESQASQSLPARSISDPIVQRTFVPEDNFWELIPRCDFVSCVPSGFTMFELQVLQRDMGKVIRLELDAYSPQQRELWVQTIRDEMVEMMQMPPSEMPPDGEGMTTISKRSPRKLCKEWLDWIRFPVQFFLRLTIPDVRTPKGRKWYPVAFMMSMVWLATFSFCVVEVCDILSDEFNISVTILGFTVAAIGTSFPNVISCIAVSKQGRTSMAIANALGANIQNVFLALALPWALQATMQGSFVVSTGNIASSVFAMLLTLLLLVLMVLVAKCTMPKWAGATFLIMYVVYLVMTIGQEVTADGCWPFPC